jgi:hypothetical protein
MKPINHLTGKPMEPEQIRPSENEIRAVWRWEQIPPRWSLYVPIVPIVGTVNDTQEN